MRRSFVCVAAVFIAAFAAGSAAPARAQEPRAGTVIVPPSNVLPPQDRGTHAHTNFLIFRPSKGGKPVGLVGPSPAGETPSSLACVYQVGPNNTNTNCPVTYSTTIGVGSPMNYDTPANGSNVIAIVDAYDYPTATSDFKTFSEEFGLPYGNECGSSGNLPCFTQVYASGSQPKSNGSWAQEEALDIEWSHAMAPHAQIVLVEAASNSNADLFQAVSVANNIVATCNGNCSSGGKGEVSMSWGGSESSSEASYDSYFTQPGVTYFASSGDSGGKVIYPSASPYVVSAGGTTVNRNSSGNFTGETTWSSAGGGPSSYEAMPPYQDITADVNNTGNRGTPDISFDANPATGVSVYDSTASQGMSGWLVFGGTSVASPSLAGIVNNAGAFDGGWDGGSNSSSVQNNLYSNYAADASSTTNPGTCKYSSSTPFNDITSGSAGTYNSGPCWDFASGIGALRGLTGPTGSGSGSTTAPFSLAASPSSVSVTQGSSNVTSNITVTPSASYTGTVYLMATQTSGSGLYVAINPTSVSSSNSWTSTLTVGAGTAAAGTYAVTVDGAETSGGTPVSSTSVSVTVNAATSNTGNFSISAVNFSVPRGGSGQTTVKVTPSGGFTGSVSLTVTGLPGNDSGSFSTNPVSISGTTSGSSTLTVTASPHGPAKTYTITITGTSGSLSSSTSVTLNIN